MIEIVALVGVVLWLTGFLVGYAWGYDDGVEHTLAETPED